MQRYSLIYTNKEGIVKTVLLPEEVLFSVTYDKKYVYKLFKRTLRSPQSLSNTNNIIFDNLNLNDFNNECTDITLIYFNDSNEKELLSNAHFNNIVGNFSIEVMEEDQIFIETLTMW